MVLLQHYPTIARSKHHIKGNSTLNPYKKATKALVFPQLQNESLLSIGQFCDDDCIAIFTKLYVHILKNNDIILRGNRNKKDNLWDISLPSKRENKMNWTTTPSTTMNYIIMEDKIKIELAQYLHATAFSPSFSTFKKAIDNGNFVTWPGINELNFKKLLGTMITLEKGHMDQE